jgi:hypothetical protein
LPVAHSCEKQEWADRRIAAPRLLHRFDALLTIRSELRSFSIVPDYAFSAPKLELCAAYAAGNPVRAALSAALAVGHDGEAAA